MSIIMKVSYMKSNNHKYKFVYTTKYNYQPN